MNEQEVRQAVFRALRKVAPEAEPETLEPGVDIREELDLDSLDILRFATAIEAETGVSVPERDYPAIVTLDGCVEYLTAAAAAL